MPLVGLGLGIGTSMAGGGNPDADIIALSPTAWWRGGTWHLTSALVDTLSPMTGTSVSATQTTAGNRPGSTASNAAFNSNATWDYVSANTDFLSTPSVDLTAGVSIFVVTKITSVATRAGILKGAPTRTDTGVSGFILGALFPSTSAIIEIGTPDVTAWYASTANGANLEDRAHIVTAAWNSVGASNAARLTWRRDGVDLVATASFSGAIVAAPSAAQPLFLGCSYSTNVCDGSASEIIVFNSKLSTTNCAKVEAVLRTRYATP